MDLVLAFDDGRGWQAVPVNQPLRNLGGADRLSATCAATGLNGKLRVSIPANQSAQPGTYTGALTLLVAPE